jgi:hypothetical protein
MLQAQLRGKLTRTEENMEDLLTSNVFGSFSYLLPEEGLLPLLINSQDSNGNPPTLDLKQISKVKYEFWPWSKEQDCDGCEPDVRITIHLTSGSTVIVYVESKFHSSKSSIADEKSDVPKDQLAREWGNLKEFATRRKATPFFLFVTADFGYPMDDFLASKQDYQKNKPKEMNMYWISWRKLTSLFSNRPKESLKRDILSDLIMILKNQGLTFYEGMPKISNIEINWLFEANNNWDWSFENCCINWKYQ